MQCRGCKWWPHPRRQVLALGTTAWQMYHTHPVTHTHPPSHTHTTSHPHSCLVPLRLGTRYLPGKPRELCQWNVVCRCERRLLPRLGSALWLSGKMTHILVRSHPGLLEVRGGGGCSLSSFSTSALRHLKNGYHSSLSPQPAASPPCSWCSRVASLRF